MRYLFTLFLFVISIYAQENKILLEFGGGIGLFHTTLGDETLEVYKNNTAFNYSFRVGYEYKFDENQGVFVRYNYTDSYSDDLPPPLTNKHLLELAYLYEYEISDEAYWGFYAGVGLGIAETHFFDHDSLSNSYGYNNLSYRRISYRIKSEDYAFLTNLTLGTRYSKRNFYVGAEINIGYAPGKATVYLKYADHPYSAYKPYPSPTYLSTTSSIKETFIPFSAMIIIGIPINLYF